MNRIMSPTPRLSVPASSLPTLGNAVSAAARATQYGVSDIFQKPQLFKKEVLILATLVQMSARIIIAWLSEQKAKEPEQKELRFREAVRTTMREIGGTALIYLLLRAVQKQVDRLLTLLMQIKPSIVLPKIGLDRLKDNLKSIGSALLNEESLPDIKPSTMAMLEADSHPVYGMNSPIAKGLKALKQNPRFSSLNVLATMKRMHNVLPILVGSLFSIVVAGFMLESFTLNRSEKVVSGLAEHKRRRRQWLHPKPSGYNVTEFMSSVMEERWRREQIFPEFGGFKTD